MQEWEIVTGKFLASVLLVVVMLGLTLLFPLFLFALVAPTPARYYRYLGILLQAAAFLSVGLWASSLTQNQIVAAIIAFALLLILWLSDNLGEFLGGTVGSIVSYTSVINHFQSFPQGVIQSNDVIYYVTLIVGGDCAQHAFVAVEEIPLTDGFANQQIWQRFSSNLCAFRWRRLASSVCSPGLACGRFRASLACCGAS